MDCKCWRDRVCHVLIVQNLELSLPRNGFQK